MVIETDAIALGRALNGGLVMGEGDIEFLAPMSIYQCFFVYMRINKDGAFVAERFHHRGVVGAPISADTDSTVVGSLGWYAKDIATYARLNPAQRDGRYTHHGYGLSNFKFPSCYSYVVFFMDDAHWPYLEDQYGNPVVPFHDKKGNQTYAKHGYAFSKAWKFKVPMTSMGGVTTFREAIVMTNQMQKADGTTLEVGESEKFCFDLIMRVRYAGSTDGLTIIIDPTGENLGPPRPAMIRDMRVFCARFAGFRYETPGFGMVMLVLGACGPHISSRGCSV